MDPMARKLGSLRGKGWRFAEGPGAWGSIRSAWQGGGPRTGRGDREDTWAEGGGREGCPHVGLEGSLLPRAPALEVVGHPASQRQGPVRSLQVPLPQEGLQR